MFGAGPSLHFPHTPLSIPLSRGSGCSVCAFPTSGNNWETGGNLRLNTLGHNFGKHRFNGSAFGVHEDNPCLLAMLIFFPQGCFCAGKPAQADKEDGTASVNCPSFASFIRRKQLHVVHRRCQGNIKKNYAQPRAMFRQAVIILIIQGYSRAVQAPAAPLQIVCKQPPGWLQIKVKTFKSFNSHLQQPLLPMVLPKNCLI